MKRLFFIFVVILGGSLFLSTCSKSVKWEEEVLLNTGQVIWVKRIDTYKSVSAYANPLQQAWGLSGRSYEFQWQGERYSYHSKPKSRGPIIVFADQERNSISIVDSAWPSCSGYGEYHWIGGGWQLQKTVNPALVGIPRNLMRYYSADEGVIPARVTQTWIKERRFDLPQHGGADLYLLASKILVNCSKEN